MEDSSNTPRNNILNKIRDKTLRHKESIRWLLDAERFKQVFGAEDWRGDAGLELSDIAVKNYDEALDAVLLTRKALDDAKQELEDWDHKILEDE